MKILMTLMGLEIGGAETHVVELSKELAARGHDITVASNGGVYVAELESVGVRHVKLPLHTKAPTALLQSYFGLKKLLTTEHFDIVHAHARIPAFVCGMLARKMNFRFITTTHGVFKVDPLLARISDWGERAIAVSFDIKQYLIDNYKMPADTISVTINGIDTVRYSRETGSGEIKKEFALSEGAFRVVHVSRIDTEAALPAFLLCEAAERLAMEIRSLEIVIAGGGTAFNELKLRTAAANKKAGREVIKLTGARTDIASIIACADVFVGVSRSALEAMSEEKPVVLAGAQGYIGILDEGVIKLAESTNFCCRGQKLPTAQLVADDLRAMYRMTPAARERLGKFNRSIILCRYSVTRMTDDCLAAYQRMTPYEKYPHGDILISGYYGFDNMGDDSLLSSMVAGIRALNPDAKITVLSNSPDRTALECGVRAINRIDLPKIAAEMKHAKLLISGGGSLLQDGTSKKSLYYYIYIMRLAKRNHLKLMLYANGLGPLVREKSRQLAADIMRDADFISLREERSRDLAVELGIERDKLTVSADPAFLIKPANSEWVDYLIRREGIKGRCFIVSVKEGNNFCNDAEDTPGAHAADTRPLIDRIANDIRDLSDEYSLLPLFVPMHTGKDIAVTEALAQKVGCGKILRGLTASELCGLMGRCEFIIGTRLHMLIFAATMGVPMVGISYDPKIDAFMAYIGQESRCLDVRTLTGGQLYDTADRLLAHKAETVAALRRETDRLVRYAKRDCEHALKLIESDETEE